MQVITAHPSPINPTDNIIYRISSEDNIIVVAITFLLYSYGRFETYRTIFDNGVYDENLKFNYEDKLIL